MRFELIGWKAWYPDGSTYDSNSSDWKEIPRMDLVILKRFFKLYDEEGNQVKDEETGKSIFYELNCGTPVCTLSSDDLKKYLRLPKVVKFMHLENEVIDKFKTIAEEDEEEPWQTTQPQTDLNSVNS